MSTIPIGKRRVGEGYPAFFIADIAANHDGSLRRALRLIRLAKEAGADAAKFQNFRAPHIVSDYAFRRLGRNSSHQRAWKKSVFEVYQAYSIPWEWTPRLKDACRRAGIEYFSAPYDYASADHLAPYVSVYKIGSGDITWLPFLRYIARKRKPVILATGAATMAEVACAVKAIRSVNRQLALLQCNTNYTADPSNTDYLNLNVITTYRRRFPGTVVGLSDHTHSLEAVLGALALGARIIERHFTDDNRRCGPDHRFALSPDDFGAMVRATRVLESALGDGIKRVEPNERESRIVQQRSLCAARDLAAGHRLLPGDLIALRPCPASAVRPAALYALTGKKISRSIQQGEPITMQDIRP